MGINAEIPVFIETNLDTQIVIPISKDINASCLQREIERAHIDIFPELGFLSIHSLMVKRDSKFYRLSESFPVKYAFEGLQTWLLHADVSRPKSLESIPEVSEVSEVSVSGIIDKYFKGFVEAREVESAFNSETPSMKTMVCSPLPPELSPVSLRRYARSEVGKRLVTASRSLSRCQNSKGSSLLKDKRLQHDCYVVRNLMFETNS